MTDNARIDEGKLIERLQVFADNLTRGSDWTGALLAAYNPTGSTAIPYERARAFLASDIVDALARRSIQDQPEAVGWQWRNKGGGKWHPMHESATEADFQRSICEYRQVYAAPPPIAGAGWKVEASGLAVATIQADDFSLIELTRREGGGFNLTIHAGDEESGRWDDLSIGLSTSRAAELVGYLAPVPDNTDARGAQVKALEDKIERQARVLCEQANRIRRLRAEVRRHLKPDPYDPRPPFSYRAIIKQNGINFAKFKAAEAERDNVTKLFLDTAKERNDLYRELGEAEAKLAAIIPGTDASGVIETLNDLNDLLNHIDDKGYMLKRAWTPELRERVWSFADRIPAAIRALDPVKAQKP